MSDSELVLSLLTLNKEQSEQYIANRCSRSEFFEIHQSAMAVCLCMDGRVHFALSAELPPGILKTFRSMGGIFNFDEPNFTDAILLWAEGMISKGREPLVFATYHFSEGDHHRGCKGHNYDSNAARRSAEELAKKIREVLHLHAIVVGIETDENAFLAHGDLEIFEVAKNTEYEGKEFFTKVSSLFSGIPEIILRDVAFLLEGNARHIREMRKIRRTRDDLMHCEKVIAVGRGFSWLHKYNEALIIGPWRKDISDAIAVSGNLILDNLREERISKQDGVVLLCGAVYDGTLAGKKEAVDAVRSLALSSEEILLSRVPEFRGILHVLPGVLNEETIFFEPI